ncbi:MAG: YdcF family protein [Candidatus Nomurabacteria bacterium]|jgi:uncharacterized SAM-binding protein YcdF (DUF218 family)|nr:YdcF family protein [Candidatus Nomurabacteria bacterium]
MSKIFIWVGIIVASVSILAIALSALLTPDDLRFCDQRPSDTENCQKTDVIVAVSGGDTVARTESAIELYRNGWADKIIFSGAAADPNSPSNAAAMREYAFQSGVPEGAIIVDEVSKNTYENAVNTAKILRKNKVKTAVLTTSPYHMRRVLWEFKRAAPEVEFRTRPAEDASWNLWFIKPTGWWRAINELGGLLMFGIRGIF